MSDSHMQTAVDPAAALPPFSGLTLPQIHLPASESDCAEAVEAIREAGVAGFDTETRPVFTKGISAGGPHLVQFAIPSAAYLFQLHHVATVPAVSALLQSPQLLKVVFGLREDRRQIVNRFGVEAEALLDLSTHFRQQGIRRDVGVVTAVAMVLQQSFHKSKRISTSNWAAHTLRPLQLLYAANDAYAALVVYSHLQATKARESLPR
jgi:ribonuclease D